MKFFVPIICLFCVPTSVLGEGIFYGDEVSYPDLKASCYPLDSCKTVRQNDNIGISSPYTCSCNRECWQYDTCCFDSPYRLNAPPIFGCRKASGSGYFMVQVCSGSIWKSWCEAEPNGENDILKLTPVTSLDTYTTYKNYYCFRCYETSENFIFWNSRLSNIDESSYNSESGYRVTYNKVMRTSVYAMGEQSFSNPFILSFEYPPQISSLVIQCEPNIVADCPKNWVDKDVLDKCNYESLDSISCPRQAVYRTAPSASQLVNSNFECNLSTKAGAVTATGVHECFDKHIMKNN